MRGVLTALAVAVVSVATPAMACSYAGDRNSYRLYQRESLDDLVARAAFVERISVDAEGAFRCASLSDRPWTHDEWNAQRASQPVQCADAVRSATGFHGLVLERFSGDGPDRFELFLTTTNGSDWFFSDASVNLPWVEEVMARRFALHAQPDFWLEPGIGLMRDNTNNCGGNPTLHPSADYVVFRDARGAVFGAEPVSGSDDPLLLWLRLPDRSDERRERIAFSPAEAFRTTTHLAEVELTECPAEAWDWPVVRQTRGGDFRRSHETDRAPTWSISYHLRDWLAWREIECRPLTLLVVDVRTGGAYLSPSFAVVEDGMVETASLFPGVNIEGPARISVDQAFEWFEAGREP